MICKSMPDIRDGELFNSVLYSMLTSFRCYLGDCNTSEGNAIAPKLAKEYCYPFIVLRMPVRSSGSSASASSSSRSILGRW